MDPQILFNLERENDKTLTFHGEVDTGGKHDDSQDYWHWGLSWAHMNSCSELRNGGADIKVWVVCVLLVKLDGT